MAATFVSPSDVDHGVLMKAAEWFAQARRKPRRATSTDLEIAQWSAIPFTRKDDLRTALRPYPECGRWIAQLSSSGTTADPVVSPWSEADEQVADATIRAIHALCPSIERARCAVIAPTHTLAAAYSMYREIELSGGIPFFIRSLDPETVCAAVLDNGVEVVFTLPLVASRIGEYFTATRGSTPADIRLLFCGGDVLSPARQLMLANMWDAEVFNMFGCSELFGPVAGPATHGKPFRWRCEPVAVEVIDPVTLSACEVGDRGVMVLSTLWPKASPLLRYWTDDTVEVVDTSSAAGTFAFDYYGRPPSMLSFAGRQVPLRDIDEVLLSCGRCGSEWTVCESRQGLLFEVEMPRRSTAAARQVHDSLHEMIGAPVELTIRQPGALPRAAPKFSVLRAHHQRSS